MHCTSEKISLHHMQSKVGENSSLQVKWYERVEEDKLKIQSTISIF